MARAENIISVGLDIGTTTTSIVMSDLEIENVAEGIGVPEVRIINKKIIFRSEIITTPFVDSENVDANKVGNFLLRQYDLAGISPEDVKTGALIITGEAARKQNARNVSSATASSAGSFVVAAAGAHMEAAISGKGSGAAKYSAENDCRILNIDIGGGTTNCSIYDKGYCVSTICMNIGGRLIQFESGSLKVKDFNKWGSAVAKFCEIDLLKGHYLVKQHLRVICDALSDSLVSVLRGEPDDLASSLLIGDMPQGPFDLDAVSFSGGVGSIYYRSTSLEQGTDVTKMLQYDDIGIALASSLRNKMSISPFHVVSPEETIYATVIGAGIHSTELSGSTIYISDPGALPLRDLPVIKASFANSYIDKKRLQEMLKIFEKEGSTGVAIVIGEMEDVSFARVNEVATALSEVLNHVTINGSVVVISENDIGKILGSLLTNAVTGDKKIISIDQINVKELDYLDIGEPLYGGTIVPVVLKSLVFSD